MARLRLPNASRFRRIVVICFLLGGCLASVIAPDPARAFTPESPEVRAMIDRALQYLSTNHQEHRAGGVCLKGLAAFKATNDDDHPLCKAALAACKKGDDQQHRQEIENYSQGLCLIYLCEVAPTEKALAQKILTEILGRQKPHGGWGYTGAERGDTSQTQYAVLGLWTARNAGLQVPGGVMEKVAGWLVRTQDPTGGWAYMGLEATTAQRVNQENVTLGLSAAGLGSVFIAADYLGILKFKELEEADSSSSELPPVFRLIKDDRADKDKDKKPAIASAVPASVIMAAAGRAVADGNNFFKQKFKIRDSNWQFYYIYALERYMSFRELADGSKNPEPDWYNQGVKLLQTLQQPDGSFAAPEGEDLCGREVNTAFATLFLLRSTKKAIAKAITGDGTLRGSRGLPKNTETNLRVDKEGRVVTAPVVRTADDMIKLLNDSKTDFDSWDEFPSDFELSSDPATRKSQIARFRRSVFGGPYAARRVAVRVLARTGELDNVPTLLHALTDPDKRVARDAHDALRFLSRRFQTVAVSRDPSDDEMRRVLNYWKLWYKSVQPDAHVD